ncbi:hypothetical protein B4086_5596 [Bacillus cereus]|nr:hypothetical protein B4086_5596 [Bacillus cereus]
MVIAEIKAKFQWYLFGAVKIMQEIQKKREERRKKVESV